MKATSALTLTLSASALLAAAPAALHAQSIGVNLGNGVKTLAPTDSAGVAPFAQANYNNVFAFGASALKDSTGSTTTAGFTVTNATSFGAFLGTPAGTQEVLNDGLFLSSNGTALTFTLTNIPYAAYSLVVYDLATTGTVQSITAGGVSFFTLSPNPISAGYVDGNAATPFTYTQGTSLLSTAPTANADYVVFPGLTGATRTFTVANLSSGGQSGLAAFQIVNAVPEPSTYALALLGGAGLLGGVMRQRRATRLRV